MIDSNTSNQTKTRLIPIFTLTVFILVISIAIYLWRQIKINQLTGKQLSSPPSISPVPTKTPTVAGYILTLPNGSTIEIHSDSKFVIWHEWLIVGVGYYSDQFVYAFNMQTGEIKKLFENNNPKQGIDNMTIVDNKLFVSIGGYLAGGGLYKLNLPPDSQSAKLVLDSPGVITKIDDQYWISHGFGDGCWGKTTYSLFNTNTYQTTEIVADSDDCEGNGTQVLTLNHKQSAIVAEAIGDTTPSNNTDIDNRHVIYTSIYQVPHRSPKQKISLISNKIMPKNITELEYDTNLKKIILKSPSAIFIFDPDTKDLNEYQHYVPDPTPTMTNIIEVSQIEFQDVLPFLEKVPSLKIETKYQSTK